MVVLTRKAGEEIVIGDNIHVTVVAIKGEKVRLGITAPKDVPVDCEDVHESHNQHFRKDGGGKKRVLYTVVIPAEKHQRLHNPSPGK
jgi:carbon storage regulator